MKLFWMVLAVVLALLVQSALTQLLPGQARVFDPFLLVIVYCALTEGETHGMLAGMTAGWVQDVHFGGTVLGFSALTKILVGFGVGLAGARFLLVGPGARALVLLLTTVADALVFQWLANVFDVHTISVNPLDLATRATVNAAVGAALFEYLDRRLPREGRA
jgi:rod shape-determining protein MreD